MGRYTGSVDVSVELAERMRRTVGNLEQPDHETKLGSHFRWQMLGGKKDLLNKSLSCVPKVCLPLRHNGIHEPIGNPEANFSC